MTIPVIILLFLLLSIVLTIIFAKGESKIIAFPLLMIAVVLGFFLDINTPHHRLYPVEYTVVKTPLKILSITDYGIFESERIFDLEQWDKKLQGYIVCSYDYFGHEDHRKFTVRPFVENKTYLNEHR